MTRLNTFYDIPPALDSENPGVVLLLLLLSLLFTSYTPTLDSVLTWSSSYNFFLPFIALLPQPLTELILHAPHSSTFHFPFSLLPKPLTHTVLHDPLLFLHSFLFLSQPFEQKIFARSSSSYFFLPNFYLSEYKLSCIFMFFLLFLSSLHYFSNL